MVCCQRVQPDMGPFEDDRPGVEIHGALKPRD